MELIITLLPVVTKDIPNSPQFTPYNFLSRCKFSTLTTRQPMVVPNVAWKLTADRYSLFGTGPTLPTQDTKFRERERARLGGICLAGATQ